MMYQFLPSATAVAAGVAAAEASAVSGGTCAGTGAGIRSLVSVNDFFVGHWFLIYFVNALNSLLMRLRKI